jgi:hypothetical protein
MSFLFRYFGDPLRELNFLPFYTRLIIVIRWVYLGESFPLRVRPKGIALGSATNWFVKSYMIHPVFRHNTINKDMEFPSFILCSEDSSQVRLKLVLSKQIFKYVDRIGPLILLIFFGMLLFGYGYVYLFIPETRGLTLEEVCRFLFVITQESHSCRSMKCIVRVLNLGTPLSGNHILVKKRIRALSKAFIESKTRRRGPLKVLRLYLVNDLTTTSSSSTIDMNVWSLVHLDNINCRYQFN